ncbi:MAG: PHB depolymerase family esterase [bacterium]
MAPGDYNLTLTTGGADRSYILHVPISYDGSKALPLVLVLHGLGGNAEGMAKGSGLGLLGDQKNFIVAYLNGTGDPQGWNTGFTPWLNTPYDDVAFVRALVAQLSSQLKVDAKRVYAVGFSNGGFMTHRLASEASDLLAAVAVVEGTIGTVQADHSVLKIATPARPIPILILHGKQDPRILYDGGPIPNFQAGALSVADAVKLWTDANGCTGTPVTTEVFNGNAVNEDYTSCPGDNEVMLVTLVNGVHQWPTLQNPAHFPGTEAVWNFFARHSK